MYRNLYRTTKNFIETYTEETHKKNELEERTKKNEAVRMKAKIDSVEDIADINRSGYVERINGVAYFVFV